MKKYCVIGVTGGFSSGKTYVAKIFAQLGAKVIDADAMVHDLFIHNTSVQKKIRTYFGKEIVAPSGEIDRKALAAKVFTPLRTQKGVWQKNKGLYFLEQLIHPLIEKNIQRQVRDIIRERKYKVVVLEIPLLFESGMDKRVDTTIVVSASMKQQISFAKKHKRLSRKAVLARIRSQMSIAAKRARADIVIHNNGTLQDLRNKTKKIYRQIIAENE